MQDAFDQDKPIADAAALGNNLASEDAKDDDDVFHQDHRPEYSDRAYHVKANRKTLMSSSKSSLI